MTDVPPPAPKSADPLHGVTLKAMVEHLAERYGWDGLGDRITIRCFTHDPTVNSSLKFLRKTPWARAKVESLYLHSVAHPRKQATSKAAVVEAPVADATAVEASPETAPDALA